MNGITHISRRLFVLGAGPAAASLLSSCGTIIYPDRVNQKERGTLDPAVIILDGIGLFFFLVPGVIAFAVDFATGAIFLPAGKEPGDDERTIFDDLTMHTPPCRGRLSRQDIEQAVSRHKGSRIDLAGPGVRVAEMDHISRFWSVHDRLVGGTGPHAG